MGTIIGDFFKKVGRGIDKMTDGNVWDGLGDVLGAPLDAAGRTVNGVLDLVGLGGDELEPGAKLLLCETALLAKMAKSDGRIDKSEIDFVNAVFDDLELDGEVRKALQGFFNEQKKDVSDIAEWAQGVLQAVVEMNPDDEDCGVEIRLQVYRHLFLMALADGELDDREIAMLRAIPDPLGFKPEVFDLVVAELSEGSDSDAGGAELAEAYATLGVSSDATDAEVRAAYKRKIAAFHPDKIQGKDLDPEWVELANEKSAKINAAWEAIKKARIVSGGNGVGRQNGAIEAPKHIVDLFRRTYDWLKREQFPSIGNPDETGIYRNPDGGWQQWFTNWATIVKRPGETKPHEVHGAICARWAQEGGAFNETGQRGWLGYPVSNEMPYVGDGSREDRISIFENGAIVWTAASNQTRTSNTPPLKYVCPKCGQELFILEDSDEYLVPCPKCSETMDLTVMEPE